MESSCATTIDPDAGLVLRPDTVSVSRWFLLFGLYLLAVGVPLAALISGEPWTWRQWVHHTQETLQQTRPAVKVLGYMFYLSLCCTFLPLPTTWLVAAVATREASIAAGISSGEFVTAVLTGTILGVSGGVASVMAHLNDYHAFTLLLRHHRVARVRNTRMYRLAARWFAKSPFFLIFIFNVIPIPVDVVRMLAATYRYPRAPFAAANFLGRFARYFVVGFATYWWNLGWIVAAGLLALAVALGAGKLVVEIVKRAVRLARTA